MYCLYFLAGSRNLTASEILQKAYLLRNDVVCIAYPDILLVIQDDGGRRIKLTFPLHISCASRWCTNLFTEKEA